MRPGVRHRALALFAVVASAAPALAGPWERVPLPVDNAQVLAMALAPSQPDRVYLALDGLGVWRTDDRGTSWIDAGNGLPVGARIGSLDVSPVDPDFAFAGIEGSVHVTTDAGKQWGVAGTVVGPGAVRALLMHPILPQVALAGVSGGSQPGVYRTTDSGASWTFTSAGLGSAWIYDLAADPADPTLVLAATHSGVARSTDGGVTWATGAPPLPFLELAWSAADPDLVYARRNNSEIHRSTDAGISFTGVAAPPGSPTALAAHPQDVFVLLAAGTGYGCFPINSSRTYAWRSTDQGGSWAEVFRDPECDVSTARALAFDPVAPTHLYFAEGGMRERGFRHSSSGGSPGSWIEKIGDIDNFEIGTLAGTVSGETWARFNARLYHDPGFPATWTDLGDSPDYDQIWASRMEANERTDGLLFEYGDALLGDIAFSFLNRSTDGGLTWWPGYDYPPGLPSVGGIINDVASNHGTGQTVYVSTWSFGLYRSDDGGATYAPVNGALQDARVAIHPADDLHVFFAGGPARMEVSFDGGVTTSPRNAGLPLTGSLEELFLEAAHPDHLGILYSDGRVYETTDGGLSWGLRQVLPVSGIIQDTSWDPGSGHVFVATSTAGVVTSHPLYEADGLPSVDVRSVHFWAENAWLFAGTAKAGLWRQGLFFVDHVPAVATVTGTLSVHPNPFRSGAAIDFVLPPEGGTASLAVYDAAGRKVRTLAGGPRAGGPHRLSWNGRDDPGRPLPSGVYFVRLTTDTEAVTRKAVILR